MPGRLAGRHRVDQHQRRTRRRKSTSGDRRLQPGAAPGRGGPARLQRRRCFKLPSSSCSARGPTATTGSTRDGDGIDPRAAASPSSNIDLWGVPADRPRPITIASPACRPRCGHVLRRDDSAADALELRRCDRPSSTTRPSCDNPTTCTATLGRRHSPTTTSVDTRRSPWPATDRLRPAQLQPEPLRAADHDRDRLRLRARRRPRCRRRSSPTSRPRRRSAATVTLPEGFTINPNAADGKTACTDAEAQLRHPGRGPVPGVRRRSARSTIDSSALPGPIPGCIYLGEPQPGDRYRLFLTADGFATHVKLAGLGHTRSRRPGSSTVSFEDLPADPVLGLQHALLRLRARPPRDPDAVRHLPGRQRPSPPGTTRSPNQTSTQFFTLDSGPDGSALPGADAALRSPTFAAGVADNTAGAHAPFSLDLDPARRRPEPRRRSRSRPRPASRRRWPASPTARTRRSPAAASSGYSGSPSRPRPSCPAGEPDRHRDRRRRRRHPPALPPRQGLPRRPLQGRAAQPRGRHPGGLRPLRPRQRRRPGRDPRRSRRPPRSPRSPIRCPQILDGIPLRLRSILVNLDRPGLHPQPDQLRPVRGQRPGLRRPGRRWPSPRLPFQVANCARPPLRAEAQPEAHRRRQPPRPPGDPRDLHGQARAKPTSPASSVTLPHGRAARQRPHRHVCTRSQFAANACPASTQLGTADGDDAAARRAARGHRLPASLQPTSCPTSWSTSGPDRLSSLRARIDRSRAPCAPPSKRPRRRRSPTSPSTSRAEQERPDRELGKHVRDEAQGQGRDDGSEQRPRRNHGAAGRQVRQGKQAREARGE